MSNSVITGPSWWISLTDQGWKWTVSAGLSHAHGYAESRELARAHAQQICDQFVAQDKPDEGDDDA